MNRRLIFCAGLSAVWLMAIFFLTYAGEGLPLWLESWKRADADWYFRIWFEGYGSDQRMLVFPPGFSYFIGSVSSLTGLSFHLVAMLINVCAFSVGSVLATEFVSQRFRLPWFWVHLSQLALPVSYFALTPYSDALFYLGFWTLLPLAARDPKTLTRREWVSATLLTLLLPWLRLTAYPLTIWLLFRRWFAFALLFSLALFLFLNWRLSGDPLMFVKMQRAFMMPAGWFYDGLRYHIIDFWHPPMFEPARIWGWFQITFISLWSLLFLMVATGWLLWRREFILAATIASVALFSRNQAFWRSVPRYDWPLMVFSFLPWLSLAFAENRPRLLKWIVRLLILASLIIGFCMQIVFARQFHWGLWGY